jgi:hypothetical protein
MVNIYNFNHFFFKKKSRFCTFFYIIKKITSFRQKQWHIQEEIDVVEVFPDEIEIGRTEE